MSPNSGPWLPTTADEIRARGWDTPDVVFVTGDAYVDHPSFAMAVLSRVLESHGENYDAAYSADLVAITLAALGRRTEALAVSDKAFRLVEQVQSHGQTLITATTADALPAAPAQLVRVTPGEAR